MKLTFKLAVLLCLFLGYSSNALAEENVKHFPHPDRIRYDGSCMTIEGKDLFIYSAAFHYFRCPEPLWRDRFKKIKEAGFNTVETYIPWNWHERKMPASPDVLDTATSGGLFRNLSVSNRLRRPSAME